MVNPVTRRGDVGEIVIDEGEGGLEAGELASTKHPIGLGAGGGVNHAHRLRIAGYGA